MICFTSHTHLMLRATAFGRSLSVRDLGAVFDHEGPLPHPARERSPILRFIVRGRWTADKSNGVQQAAISAEAW